MKVVCFSYQYPWPFSSKNRVSPAALAACRAALAAEDAQDAASRAAASAAAASAAAAVAYAAAGATSPYIDEEPEEKVVDGANGKSSGKWSLRRSFERFSFGLKNKKSAVTFRSPVSSFASHGDAASIAANAVKDAKALYDAQALAEAQAFRAAKAVAEEVSPIPSPGDEIEIVEADDNAFDHPSIKQTGRVQILRQLWATAKELPPHARVKERSLIMKDVSIWNELSHTAPFHREG